MSEDGMTGAARPALDGGASGRGGAPATTRSVLDGVLGAPRWLGSEEAAEGGLSAATSMAARQADDVELVEVRGSRRDDRRGGTDGADEIRTGSGDDRIWAKDGDDLANGGSGDDRLCMGEGDDTARGGSGSDVFYGHDWKDTLKGGGGKTASAAARVPTSSRADRARTS